MHHRARLLGLSISIVAAFHSSLAADEGQSAMSSRPIAELNKLLPTKIIDFGRRDASPSELAAINEIRRRVFAGDLSNEDWETVLTPDRVMHCRRVWPKGEPLFVQLELPPWLGSTCEIRATPRLKDAKTIRCGRTWSGPCGMANSMSASHEPAFDGIERAGVIGTLSESQADWMLDVEIRCGSESDANTKLPTYSHKYWDESRILYQGTLRYRVEQTDDRGAVCAPDATPETSASAKEVIKLTIYHHRWADGGRRGYLNVDLDRRVHAIPDVAFGFTVNLLRDNEQIESIEVPGWTFWQCASGCFPSSKDMIFETLLNQDQTLADAGELARWSVCVRSVDLLAWTDWERPSYWSGEFTIPLSAVYKDANATSLGFSTVRLVPEESPQ